MNDGVHETASAVVISLYVQPGAKRDAWAGRHGAVLKVRLAAPPIDGRANAALLAFVAETLELPRAQVTLLAGASSRHKRLRLTGITAEQVRRRLAPRTEPATGSAEPTKVSPLGTACDVER